ncbi:MAG: 2OG-Fe(II) oxygenase [Leptolyngbya sp. SIO1E4]|nr:2OG-Fe(II) oxygenase [Leptolyngbya sp. SIO1E4]
MAASTVGPNPQFHSLQNPNQRFQTLVDQSMDVLATLLADTQTPVPERAAIALQILQAAGLSTQPVADAPNHDSPQNGAVSAIAQQLSKTFNASQPALEPPVTDVGSQGEILPAQYIQIDRFLSPEEHQQALDIAWAHQKNFVSTTTTTNATDYRQSAVLYATFFAEFYELLTRRILDAMPAVLNHLNLAAFPVTQVEMQLTAHNDGCFYRIHNDSGDTPSASRVLTYVYYFNQEPKAYSGGELALYETHLKGGSPVKRDRTEIIEPRNNSIIFFDSRCLHEVLPISCPSQEFRDGRFTLNGWLRR